MPSKKQSVANSNLKQLEKHVFFIDRSLGQKAVASVLRDTGLSVVVHDEHFPQNTQDEVWLKVAGDQAWIVLSKDNRIRRRANELQALQDAKVLAFILTAANATGSEMASILLRAHKKMLSIASDSKRPAIYTIGRDAKPKKINI